MGQMDRNSREKVNYEVDYRGLPIVSPHSGYGAAPILAQPAR
jgi:hypothetical protein